MDASTSTAALQLLTPAAVFVFAYLNRKGQKKAEEQAEAAKEAAIEVKKTLITVGDKTAEATKEVKAALLDSSTATKTSLEIITGFARDTHTLVNSRTGEMLRREAVILRASAVMARQLALETGNTAERAKAALLLEDAADEAEKRAGEHDSKQAIVDAGHTIVNKVSAIEDET
jgi:hypothetical protein